MSTHNYTTDKNAMVRIGNNVHKAEALIDLGDFDVNANDVLQCLKLPKGAVVHQAGAIIITPDSNAVDATVRIGTTELTDALNADGTQYDAVHLEEAVIAASGYLVTADDTLDLLIETEDSAGDGEILVYAAYSMIEYIANSDVRPS